MDRNTTNLLKFGCCLLIFFHHFYILEDFVCTWGRTACSVFFFLSAYGVSKSQQKNNYHFITFFKKRLSRIFIPYLITIFLAILFSFFLAGSFSIPIYQLVGHEICFVEGFSILDFFIYLFGVKKIDGAMWFIDVIIISYAFIWLILRLKIKWLRLSIVLTVPVILLVLDRLLSINICKWPTDVIGIVIGIVFFEYETSITATIKRNYRVCLSSSIVLWFFFVGLYMFLQNTESVKWRYMELTILLFSIFSICVACCLSLKKVKYTKICSLMGGGSFFIYLLHIKVINVLAYYDVVPLLLSSLICVMVLSYLFYLLDKQIQILLWKQ